MEEYKLPKLGFDYADLEPVFSKEAVEIHYLKHHAGYVAKLNDFLAKCKTAKGLSEKIDLQKFIAFNGGGHLNHSFFWEGLKPKKEGGGVLHKGKLESLIKKDFTGLDKFKEEFFKAALGIMGWGWQWLTYCPKNNILKLKSTSNHDLVTTHLKPILCVDVWEHAYYLQYKNDRAKYLENIWTIIDWDMVGKRLDQIIIN